MMAREDKGTILELFITFCNQTDWMAGYIHLWTHQLHTVPWQKRLAATVAHGGVYLSMGWWFNLSPGQSTCRCLLRQDAKSQIAFDDVCVNG